MSTILSEAFNLIGRFRLRNRVALVVGNRSTVRLDRVSPVRDCTLVLGSDCIINTRISFDRQNAKFKCGDRCYVGLSNIVIADSVSLGDDVVISWGVTIVDHNSHAIAWADRAKDILDWGKGTKDWQNVTIAPVTINDKAWIGFNAIILKGITIGEGAIVAAGAVVTKNVPAYTIVAGNPAQVIRTLPEAMA
ncbi:acyltransferase [Sphingorhabdus sp. IMCC26285]|uniref:Acyltransferase n=1 Tax=Sphingorhabdus profundilacus TaxID=2509718 RepID=A0A6I4M3H8_9SPHN|nr:acyltransferase [Sphingorhabdus profundilacus]MVZ98460.1 acyltransferase [Sphingorhabdus profundilacus]